MDRPEGVGGKPASVSAYVVSKEHIDLLVQVAYEGPRDRATEYPSHGWHGPRWYAAEPKDTWTLDDRRAHRRQVRLEELDRVGQVLIGECLASVAYRYSPHGRVYCCGDEAAKRSDALDDLPGPVDRYYVHSYKHQRHAYRLTVVEALATIDTYEYQSCEHPGWTRSEAFRICNALRRSLIRALPGYRDATGDWNQQRTAERYRQVA